MTAERVPMPPSPGPDTPIGAPQRRTAEAQIENRTADEGVRLDVNSKFYDDGTLIAIGHHRSAGWNQSVYAAEIAVVARAYRAAVFTTNYSATRLTVELRDRDTNFVGPYLIEQSWLIAYQHDDLMWNEVLTHIYETTSAVDETAYP